MTYLRMLETFEEGRDSDQANIVIPHDDVRLLGAIFTRHTESVLKYYRDCQRAVCLHYIQNLNLQKRLSQSSLGMTSSHCYKGYVEDVR